MNDNPISTFTQGYKKVTVNPIGSSALWGGVGFGTGYLGWDRGVEAARALLRRPVTWLSKMTPEEFDEEVDDIKADPKLRWIIPGALGAGIMGLGLMLSYRPNESYGGLLSWEGKPKPLNQDTYRNYTMPGSQNLQKSAALQKLSNSVFEYSGYVPDLDFSRTINAPVTKRQLFSNDPWLQNEPYVQNMGISILSDAQRRTGAVNVPMGSVYDSAVDKFKSKFSLGGIASVGAQTILANTASTLFVKALGAVTGLDEDKQKKLVELGTWAGAARAILS